MKLTDEELANSLMTKLISLGWLPKEQPAVYGPKQIEITAVKNNNAATLSNQPASFMSDKQNYNSIQVDYTGSKHDLVIQVCGAKTEHKTGTDDLNDEEIKHQFSNGLLNLLYHKNLNPDVQLAIATPNDNTVSCLLKPFLPGLYMWNVRHFWVSGNGLVTEHLYQL